jgi:malate permease and related proteins
MFNNLIVSLSIVLPLFINIIVGYSIKRIGLVKTSSFVDFNNVTFNVLFPILIFDAIYTSRLEDFLNFRLMISLLIITLILFAYGQISSRIVSSDKSSQPVISHSMFRTNFLMIGIPIITSLFGTVGVTTAFLLLSISNPIFNPLSVLNFELFDRKNISIKKIWLNIITSPLNIATLLGFIFLIFNIPLPNFILVSTSSLSTIAPTLALLILGGTLDLSKFKLFDKDFLFALINRLIIIPFVLLFVLLSLNFPPVEIAALVLFFATPVAVISFSFTLEYKANTDLASSLIVVSTLLSSLSLIALVTVMQIVFN